MKKQLVLLGMIILLLNVLVVPVNAGTTEEQQTPSGIQAGEDFTHSVLLELFVTTWCGYCPSAEAAALQLNGIYGPNFVFVTMVTDDDEHGGNGKAGERSDDYQVSAIPDGIFDGNYRRELGGQDGTDTYAGHIEDSGDRNVPDIDLEVTMTDNGDGTMEIGYDAGNMDILPVNAHLRVYIVEKVSRWPDKDGHAIPYGFIDYAFDKDVQLPSGAYFGETMTWDYMNHENASFDNYVVIAGLFDKSMVTQEGFILQSATTETANVFFDNIEYTPEYPKNSDDVTVQADVTGDFQELQLEYAICTDDSCGANQYVDMELVEGDIYTATMGDFGSDSISVHFKIVATSGGQDVKSELVEIEFGKTAPGGGSDDESESFAQDPAKMGLVGLGILLLVPLAIYFVDRRNEDGEDWEDYEDEVRDDSVQTAASGEDHPEMLYDEEAYDGDYSDNEYYDSWDKQLK